MKDEDFEMIPDEDDIIPLRESELADLIRDGHVIDVVFGTGGAALKITKGQKYQTAVRAIAQMRGCLDQNRGGDGI
jgi:hypothetical protein